MKNLFILLVPVICCGIFSCTKSNDDNPGVTKTITLPANGAAVVQANNIFGLKFLQAQLKEDAADNNKLISPLSIYLALSMVYNGADNTTKDSIAAALQSMGISIDDINATCKAIIEQLPGEDSKVTMDIANSIWYKQRDIQPLPAFITATTNYFDAQVQPITTADAVNSWVNDKTKGKIKKVLESISPEDLMYLINAIYFKGSWQHKFKTEDTHNAPFYLQDGSTIPVPFMQQKDTFNIAFGSGCRAVEIPYGGGNSYSMYLIDGYGSTQPVNELAANLNTTALSSFTTGMHKADVTLVMPKWESSYAIDNMRPVLAALGMDIAFTDVADFGKMYTATGVQITKAIHKTYIKVDEEGTVAAAVTGIGMTATSMPVDEIIKFDHPFMYIIAEKQTGAVLFTGILNNPSAAN